MSNVRGKPFQLGNHSGHGRPKGSQNKGSLLAQQLLNEHAEPVMRKCLVEALKGDRNALRLCLERIAPVRRDRCIQISRLPTRTTADLDRSSQRVMQAIARGQITPNEGESLVNILADRRRILETAELEPRLKALEQRSEHRDRTAG